uniref:VWA domain-containing protein n=1 Tax=Dictyoglomus turgidum TaxID=513050 RepID=A0A7C3WMC4_9BACT
MDWLDEFYRLNANFQSGDLFSASSLNRQKQIYLEVLKRAGIKFQNPYLAEILFDYVPDGLNELPLATRQDIYFSKERFYLHLLCALDYSYNTIAENMIFQEVQLCRTYNIAKKLFPGFKDYGYSLFDFAGYVISGMKYLVFTGLRRPFTKSISDLFNNYKNMLFVFNAFRSLRIGKPLIRMEELKLSEILIKHDLSKVWGLEECKELVREIASIELSPIIEDYNAFSFVISLRKKINRKKDDIFENMELTNRLDFIEGETIQDLKSKNRLAILFKRMDVSPSICSSKVIIEDKEAPISIDPSGPEILRLALLLKENIGTNKKRRSLSDSGTSLNVGALINSKHGGSYEIFNKTGYTKGNRLVVLIDKSGSMDKFKDQIRDFCNLVRLAFNIDLDIYAFGLDNENYTIYITKNTSCAFGHSPILISLWSLVDHVRYDIRFRKNIIVVFTDMHENIVDEPFWIEMLKEVKERSNNGMGKLDIIFARCNRDAEEMDWSLTPYAKKYFDVIPFPPDDFRKGVLGLIKGLLS